LRLNNFDWSVFEGRLLKIGDEFEKIDSYHLNNGIFGLASEGIFAMKFAYFWENFYGNLGNPGLMRKITNSQREIIKLLSFCGIFNYLFITQNFEKVPMHINS